MPVRKGRPPAKNTRIEDCVSIAFNDNPTPLCPHGKFRREWDYDRQIDRLRERQCGEPECVSNEYHPHAGEFVELKASRTFGGRKPLRDFYNLAVLIAEENVPPPDNFEERLAALVTDVVVAWDWTGPDGNVLPLPREDWNAVENALEYAELLWIVEAALRDGDPREAFHRPPDLPSGKDSDGG